VNRVGVGFVPVGGVVEAVMSSAWCVVSVSSPFCVGVLWDLAVARVSFGGRGSVDPSVCAVAVRGHRAGGGVHGLVFRSSGSVSVATRLSPSSSWSLEGLLCRWSGPRSSSSSPAGEGGDLHASVQLCFSSSSSCEHVAAESGDFPSALIPPEDTKASPAPGGSGHGGAAARLRSASMAAVELCPKDFLVISVLYGVCCNLSCG
jgi:hypothetical protein